LTQENIAANRALRSIHGGVQFLKSIRLNIKRTYNHINSDGRLVPRSQRISIVVTSRDDAVRHCKRFKTPLKVAKDSTCPHQKSDNYEEARRWRATSKAATETATPAFSELIRPSCGIDTTVAHRLRVKVESPFSSPPTTMATGPEPRSKS